ncbi:2-dehydropantoate 2-reductase [Neobacillus sp. D3-1R]|uniref:2-dehydropantoate 2-reductase n=1 Tax=Neobacillus sp. D3-1R TaxID=3445778 RepID=UPI003FA0B5D6
MKIGIIGGGSIGLLYAYYLSNLFEVTLYTNTKDQADTINSNGIQLFNNGIVKQAKVKSFCVENWTGEDEWTIIAVKQYHLEFLLNKLMKVKPLKPINFLFLQNGMGHLKYLEKLDVNSILVGSIDHGAYKINSYSVEHNGIGQTKVAIYKGEFSLPSSIFSIPHFPFVKEENYYNMLLKKLVANAIINPLTALLKIPNGEIIQNEYYFQNAISLFNEIKEILNIDNADQYFQQVINICQNTSTNRSSMLKDIEAHRPTEIDAIVGYILDQAALNQKEAPICQTLYRFIKGIEG